MIRLGILGSTRGTNLFAITEAIAEKQLNAEIAIVISNRATAPILTNAAKHHLPVQYIDPAGITREAYDEQLSEVLRMHQVDLIVLIGYMRILSVPFVTAWENRVINVHPSLLPAFAGLMDLDVHQAVINAHATESGCTVHYVTPVVDAGPILLQKTCPVFPEDDALSLKQRVQTLEGQALVEAINRLSREEAFIKHNAY